MIAQNQIQKNYLWGFAALAILLFGASLALWFIMPVYPDEIAHKIWVSRAFIDDWHRISVMPECESTAILPIPYLFYPAAFVLSGYTLLDGLISQRIVGILFFVSVLSMLACAMLKTARKEGDPLPALAAFGLVCGLFIGVMPASMVMMRAEHIIMVLLTFTCLALTFSSLRVRQFSVLLIIFLYSMALYSHPKTAYFLPGISVAVAALTRERRALMAGALALLLAITGYGIVIGQQLMTCPEVPVIQNGFTNFNIKPWDLFLSPGQSFSALAVQLPQNLFDLIRRMNYRHTFTVRYLPSVDMAHISPNLANIFTDTMETGIASLFLFLLFTHGRACLSLLKAKRKKAPKPEQLAIHAMLGLLSVGLSVQFLLNRVASFYDVAFWLSGMIVLNIFALLLTPGSRPPKIWRRGAILCFAAFGLLTVAASDYASGRFIFPELWRGYAGPNVAFRDFYNGDVAKDVDGALAQCHLRKDSPRLVIDDETYFFLQDSPDLMPITYATIPGKEKMLPWLKEHASGIVTRCDSIVYDGTQIGIKKSGTICCANFVDTSPPP